MGPGIGPSIINALALGGPPLPLPLPGTGLWPGIVAPGGKKCAGGGARPLPPGGGPPLASWCGGLYRFCGANMFSIGIIR